MNLHAVHCLLDAMAVALANGNRIEHRPLYCGSWDDPVALTDDGSAFTYYSPELTDDVYVSAFERLYGTPERWYRYGESKRSSYGTLLKQLERKSEDEYVLVQLDLYFMPYPNRCYGTLHRPHFVLVERHPGGGVLVKDPYFGWEGPMPFSALHDAFFGNELGGGLTIRKSELGSPTAERIAFEFETTFNEHRLPLADAFAHIVHGALDDGSGRSVRALGASVDQLGILARRKYGYGKVSSLLADWLGLKSDPVGERAGRLVQGWMNAGYAAVRASIRQSRDDVVRLTDKAEALRDEERQLKRDLQSLYDKWKEAHYDGTRTGEDRLRGRTIEAGQ